MTSAFRFSQRSRQNLDVHPDLQKVVERALELSPIDFIITDGGRTHEEQVQLVANGASKTMHSRHLGGFAVDYVALVSRRVCYDLEPMTEIANAFKAAAEELGIPIKWGGDWKSFKDTPHIELCKERYPDGA